jgi:hypothetical protein
LLLDLFFLDLGSLFDDLGLVVLFHVNWLLDNLLNLMNLFNFLDNWNFVWPVDVDLVDSLLDNINVLDHFDGCGNADLYLLNHFVGDLHFDDTLDGNLHFDYSLDRCGHRYLTLAYDFPGVWYLLDSVLDKFVGLEYVELDVDWLRYFHDDGVRTGNAYLNFVWLRDGYLNFLDNLSDALLNDGNVLEVNQISKLQQK